jgi:hypothetical protein
MNSLKFIKYWCTHKYCKTSFQYISLGISPLRLFCARSLKPLFHKIGICHDSSNYNLVQSKERNQEMELTEFSSLESETRLKELVQSIDYFSRF